MNRSAFTLLEIIASIAVLGIVVILMAVLFADSETAWKVGSDRAQTTMSAQAALEIIGRDLKHAVANSNFIFRIMRDEYSNSISYGWHNDTAVFVSMQRETTEDTRTACGIGYWVQKVSGTAGPGGRYELVRALSTEDVYANTNWYNSTNRQDGIIAENVAAFRMWAGDNTGGLASYTNDTHRLPYFVDIYIELLDSDAARRADAIEDDDDRNRFLDIHARRYTSRINFPDRNGFKDR